MQIYHTTDRVGCHDEMKFDSFSEYSEAVRLAVGGMVAIQLYFTSPT